MMLLIRKLQVGERKKGQMFDNRIYLQQTVLLLVKDTNDFHDLMGVHTGRCACNVLQRVANNKKYSTRSGTLQACYKHILSTLSTLQAH